MDRGGVIRVRYKDQDNEPTPLYGVSLPFNPPGYSSYT